jgi:hypothetical protein
MDRALLDLIAQEQRRYGSALQPPATDEQIHRLVEQARVELRTDLPAAYLDFLRLTNGLDWNGVVLYGTATLPMVGHADRSIAGIVEMNLSARNDERFDDLLVLGSNGMDLYTVRVSTSRYEIYDEVPHELVDSTGTCAELLVKALTRALQ